MIAKQLRQKKIDEGKKKQNEEKQKLNEEYKNLKQLHLCNHCKWMLNATLTKTAQPGGWAMNEEKKKQNEEKKLNEEKNNPQQLR